ncbi:MAG: isoaspartyl peptidase/L-asparaginase [Gammaproteobacteria bacterium]|nr:isoaspartyl peptidase/L-asparaginase [Gammaproteobacteria bacterium]NNM14465.1 isoaspartyl peptidase/L-asparaginase [Gammaproteobacteria bacterium]
MNKSTHYGLVIHGGAGTITRKNLSPEKESALRAKLSEAIQAGYKTLNDGGSSIDAVSATIVILENSPLFNAGKGAVFTSEQTHELDASLMDGRDLNAGAITSVKNVKNPILLAEQVMLNSRHVMLSGKGAEEFAKQQNLELVENAYFSTDFRLQQLHKAKLREKQHNSSDHPMEFDDEILDEQSQDPEHKFGTVGAVAIDKNGNLAAGTSTGGMTNKRFGRIGDSPVIGAGTYADNRSCAVSATGHGEYFIRYAVAHDVCARVMHGKKSLQQAADEVIMQDLLKANGSGGIVAIDKNGNFVLTFNTEGMYRGYKFSDVNEKIQIYKM